MTDENDAGDAVRFVRVGTLDNPDRLPPDIHIFNFDQAAVGRASGGNACRRGVLRSQGILAEGKPRAPRGDARSQIAGMKRVRGFAG
jgi:hypothetical protein